MILLNRYKVGVLMFLNISQAYIDFYAALIALVIFLALVIKKSYFSYAGTQFMIVSFLIFILCMMEGITFLYPEIDNDWIISLIKYITFLLFIVTPLMLAYLVKYIYFLIKKRRISASFQTIFFIPFIIVTILSIINLFSPFIYDFSGNEIYERLEGYTYVSLLSSISVFFVIIFLIINHKELNKSVFFVLISSYLLPIIGGFLQIFNENWATIYLFSSFALLVAYIYTESIGITRDYLTNVFTRKKAFEIVETYLLKDTNFLVGLFDMDNLKNINDSYGHLVGDAALLHLTAEMNRVFDSKVIISRIGGDEFVIIGKDCEKKDIENKINQTNKQFIYNSKTYNISFSYGLKYVDGKERLNADDLFIEVDRIMYTMKQSKKEIKTDNPN